MKLMRLVLLFLLALALIFAMGCGKSTEKKIAEVKTLVDSLRANGVPDSLLTEVDVLCFRAQSEKKRGSPGEASKAIDKAVKMVNDIKGQYASTAEASLQSIDSLKKTIKSEREKLSGMRVAKIDSTLMAIDSLLKEKLVLKAQSSTKELANIMPGLQMDEEKSMEVAKKVIGAWSRSTLDTNKEAEINNVEKQYYKFKKNGKFDMIESRKGLDGPALNWNYKYNSFGHYEINADTVHFRVKKIKGYNKSRVLVSEEPKKWRQVEDPPFDSLVTDGSQDKWTTYTELKQYFKKGR